MIVHSLTAGSIIMEVLEIQNLQQEEHDMALLVHRMGQKDYDRLILAVNPSCKLEECLELTWIIASNQIVQVESEVRWGAINLRNLYTKQRKANKLLESERNKTFKNLFKINQLEDLIQDLDKQVELSLNYLAVLARLTNSLLDTFITVADIYLKNSQLMGTKS